MSYNNSRSFHNNTYLSSNSSLSDVSKQNIIVDVSFENKGGISNFTSTPDTFTAKSNERNVNIHLNDSNVSNKRLESTNGSGGILNLTIKSNSTDLLITIVNPGKNYYIGDIINVDNSIIGVSITITITHIEKNTNKNTEFKVNMYEPLQIFRRSNIYLDNFLTINGNINNINNMAACLQINEFNIKTNVGCSDDIYNSNGTLQGSGSNIFNNIIIPNENDTINNINKTVAHKAKKFNYICDINPMTINSISGKITNLQGEPFFTHSIFKVEFTGSSWSHGVIPHNTEFIITTHGNAIVDASNKETNIQCVTYGNTNINENVIYITTTCSYTEFYDNIINSANDIYFVFSDEPFNTNVYKNKKITDKNTPLYKQTSTGDKYLKISPTNIDITDVGWGRFIAEFSIVPKE